MILLQPSPPHHHHHHHHPHHHHPHQHVPPPPTVPRAPGLFELAQTEVAAPAVVVVAPTPGAGAMPESGDVEVLAPPRIHLASRRRFELKLDLASALSGRERSAAAGTATSGSSGGAGGGGGSSSIGGCGAEKKPRLELLSAPAAMLSTKSKFSDSVSCASCIGGGQNKADDSPVDSMERSISASACLGLGACTTTTNGNNGSSSQAFRAIGSQQEDRASEIQLHHHHHLQYHHHHHLLHHHLQGNVATSSSCSSSSSSSATTSCSVPSCAAAPGVPTSPAVRCISCGELAGRLRRAANNASSSGHNNSSSSNSNGHSRALLVIDCRPFLCYNSQHVQGALNISCTDRFNRKRLQQGKVGVLDLLAATHGRDQFRRRHVRDVVLYDDRSSGSSGLDADSALSIVLTTLHREGRQPVVLQGGMKQFEAEYPDLCWSSRRQVEVPGRLLCSPTNDTIEPEIETATASQILPFLYLGNERDAAELERLRRHNITYVLNVTAHVPQYWQAHGIRYKRIPASDSAQQNLKQYFEEAIEYIDDARQNDASVLIHCHAGVSRSATITIAYILKHTKMAMSDAYKYVKGKRGIISPNFNFLGQLLEFEQDLNDGNSLRILNPRLVELESTV